MNGSVQVPQQRARVAACSAVCEAEGEETTEVIATLVTTVAMMAARWLRLRSQHQ